MAQYRKRGGSTFGPYWFRVWREDGKTHKAYVRPADLESTRIACAREAEERRERSAARARVSGTMNDFTFLCRVLARLEATGAEQGASLAEDEAMRLARILALGIGS